MNLFRNRNKRFEEKLSEQLEGLEFKPADSLWDKIDRKIPNSAFESKVADRVNSYNPKPSPETWDYIERQLPAPGAVSFKRFYWIPLLLLFTGSAAWLGYELKQSNSPAQVAVTQPAGGSNVATSPSSSADPSSQEQKRTGMPATTPAGNEHPVMKVEKTVTKQNPSPSSEIQEQVLPLNEGTIPALLPAAKSFANLEAASPAGVARPARMGRRITTQKGRKAVLPDPKVLVVKEESPQEQASLKNLPAVAPVIPAVVSSQSEAAVKAEGADAKAPQAGIQSEKPRQLAEQITGNTLTSGTPAGKQEAAGDAGQSSTGAILPAGSVAVVPPASINQQPTSPANTATEEAKAMETPAAGLATATPQSLQGHVTNADDLTQFSITVLSGGYYCFNNLSAPSQSTINFTENIALRRTLETPAIDWSGSFLLDYALNNRCRISTGLMVTNFRQNFEYAITAPVGNHVPVNEVGARVTNYNDSIVSGNSFGNHIKYTWTELPLLFTYSFANKSRVGFEVMTGISYAIITGVDAAYVSYDNVGVFAISDKNGFPGVKNSLFVHFNPTVTYSLSHMVSFGLAPSVKYSITSITGNEHWVEQRPLLVGLSASLRKKF